MSEITLIIDNISTTLGGKITGPIYKKFKHELGYRPENAAYMMENSKWFDGWITTVCWDRKSCRCAIKKDGTHFPTGLWSKAKEFLQANGYNVKIVDSRGEKPKRTLNLSITNEFKFHEYQKFTISESVKKQRGIIQGATGFGKTSVCAGIITELGVSPTVFYVTSLDLLNQAYDEFTRLIKSNGQNIQIGRVGGGECNIQDITIMTVQTGIRSLGEKYEKFDDEDVDEDSIDLESNREKIKNLIQSAKCYFADECITGDSIVITRSGLKQFKDLDSCVGEDILSHNGKTAVWKKITAFMAKGEKSIIEIELLSGRKIRCTKNHPLMSQRGWVAAGDLKNTDQILSFANVDVEHHFQQKEEVQADTENMFLDTKLIKDLSLNGGKSILNLSKMHQYVNADVEKKLDRTVLLFKPLLTAKEIKDTFQNVCDINYVGIKTIKDAGKEYVYDITVDDTHCFFANGILVHNCQHWAAKTCQIIADNSINAYHRFAASATPHRDLGDDVLIDACFGRNIVNIKASDLIKQGFLVRPEICFVPIKNLQKQDFGNYANTYKFGIVENSFRNEWISNLAKALVEKRRVTLILVKQIAHGEELQRLIPGSVFLHGSCSKNQRKEHIELMRTGKASITIASQIFDEGIDCRVLDALVLCGGGKSSSRALQRIGRVIRNYTYSDGRKKENAYVYDFHDFLPYLSDHALARLKMYKTEPEWKITRYEI